MADETKRESVTKEALIAQLEGARWQIGREMGKITDQVSQKMSVRGQLQESIRRQPSAWGFGTVLVGFIVTRLLFSKKTLGKSENALYRRPRLSLISPARGWMYKTFILFLKSSITKVVVGKLLSSRKSDVSNV